MKEIQEKENSRLLKVKRIFALILAVLLVCMYAATLVFAITDNVNTMSFFKASVALTIIVPVLLYAYQLVYRVVRSFGEKNENVPHGKD